MAMQLAIRQMEIFCSWTLKKSDDIKTGLARIAMHINLLKFQVVRLLLKTETNYDNFVFSANNALQMEMIKSVALTYHRLGWRLI